MPDWKLDPETKTYSLKTHGGTLTLSRREDTKKLEANFVYLYPAEGRVPPETVTAKIALHDIEAVADAQEAAISRLTEHLDKTGYEFHRPKTDDVAERVKVPDAI